MAVSDWKKSFRRRGQGGILAAAGYVLSPFSWWNDLYVNLPIAYVAAWCVSRFDRGLFEASFIAAYWLTNLAGLLMLHSGMRQALGVCRTLPSAEAKTCVPTDSSGKTALNLTECRPKIPETTRFCLEQPVEDGQNPCRNAKSDRLLAREEDPERHHRQEILIDILVSLVYTVFVLILFKTGVIRPVELGTWARGGS